jgi:hypothetical protein
MVCGQKNGVLAHPKMQEELRMANGNHMTLALDTP